MTFENTKRGERMPRTTEASPRRRASAARQHRRADARRNVEAILDAAERCLARDPDASMAEIAAEAGLGGHFAGIIKPWPVSKRLHDRGQAMGRGAEQEVE
jgi:hypothetical protein